VYGDDDSQVTARPQLPQAAMDVVDAISMRLAIVIAISAFMGQLLLDDWLILKSLANTNIIPPLIAVARKRGLMH